MPEQETWRRQLQQQLQTTVHTFFLTQWPSVDDGSEKGFIIDVRDTAFMLKGIDILQVDRTGPMTVMYVRVIDPEANSVREIHNLVHHVLSLVDEHFFVFMPLHDEEAMRFWYLTGTASHGHEGMVIIKRADIPQVALAQIACQEW